MSKLSWNYHGTHYFETGVRNGVLYVMNSDGTYRNGVAWNGLTAITVSPAGGEANSIYADDKKYLNIYSKVEIGGTLEAYTYPDEFFECDGYKFYGKGGRVAQQNRKSFGLCWRTILGNDIDGNDHAYRLHLLYGVKASPSEKPHKSVNDSPEAITFSWDLSTMPVEVDGFKPTSYMMIDSLKCDPSSLAFLEDILYGSEEWDPTFLFPNDVVDIIGAHEEDETAYNLGFLDSEVF